MPRRTLAVPADRIAVLCGARVVRVAQLEQLGLRRSTIAQRCRPGGPWQSLCPGVVLLHNAPPVRDDRRRGGLLHAGPGAVITGLDALELHGMRRVPQPSGPVRLLVAPERRVVGHGLVVVERTTRLPVAQPSARWPLAPLPRALWDFARDVRHRDQIRSAVAEAVQRRLCTPAALAAELAAGNQRYVTLPRAVLEEIGDGVRSVAEATARRLVLHSALPRPLWNPTLVDARTGRFIAVPDAWFDEVGLAWEIDSAEWHLSPEDHEETLARRVRMTAEGIWVVSHTPSQLGRDALVALARNLEQAAYRPRPAIRAVPAPTSGTLVR